jgi:hypothetical protein
VPLPSVYLAYDKTCQRRDDAIHNGQISTAALTDHGARFLAALSSDAEGGHFDSITTPQWKSDGRSFCRRLAPHREGCRGSQSGRRRKSLNHIVTGHDIAEGHEEAVQRRRVFFVCQRSIGVGNHDHAVVEHHRVARR